MSISSRSYSTSRSQTDPRFFPAHLGIRTRGGPTLLCLGGRGLVLSILFLSPPTLWFLCVLVICKRNKDNDNQVKYSQNG